MALDFITFILKLFFLIFLILLPFLYDLSAKFRYYFKFFVFNLLITCASIIFIPFGLWKPLQVTNILIASRIFNFISRVLNIKWNVIGTENLRLNESCILVANHQTPLDILGILRIYPHIQKCVLTVKKELIYTGPFGLGAWLCGAIRIDENRILDSKYLFPLKVKQLKNDNISLLMFPEGRTYCDGEIHSFKKGAFYLAIKEQLPIIPVVFSNYYFLDEQEKIFDPGYITIEILPSIPTKNLSTDDAATLIEGTRKKMQGTFQKLSTTLTPQNLSDIRNHYAS